MTLVKLGLKYGKRGEIGRKKALKVSILGDLPPQGEFLALS